MLFMLGDRNDEVADSLLVLIAIERITICWLKHVSYYPLTFLFENNLKRLNMKGPQ